MRHRMIITYNKMIIINTGWRRLIGSPKLQIMFHKRATKYRSLLRKMTYKDKGSYESLPPCNTEWHILIIMFLSVCRSCWMSDCVAVCCSVLQCVAVRCSVLQCVAVCCSVLQGVAVCCSVLQCVAVCCSVLQCATVCYSVLLIPFCAKTNCNVCVIFVWCVCRVCVTCV